MKQFRFAKIREFREAAGMTQDVLAAKLSTKEQRVYVQQVSAWENGGKGGMTIKTLMKLCKALKKETTDFFV